MMAESQTLKEARQKAYRQVILSAAERVFANYGFEAAKIQMIAEEADVSVGTIYSVFGSKSELFGVVLTHRLPELLPAKAEWASAVRVIDPLEWDERSVLTLNANALTQRVVCYRQRAADGAHRAGSPGVRA